MIDKNQQFQLVLLSALTLSFREGFKSSLKELAKTHGGGSGPWLDEIETTLLRELKSSVTEGVDITIEAEAMTGAINMLKMFFAEVIGFIKGKSSIWIAQNIERKAKNFTGHKFWARGYFVSTVGRDEETIRAYIRNQELQDRQMDQLALIPIVPSRK